ncbi:hypothetical protein H2201_008496 [Coniosporium apollinis]|uniref:Uncharacterized protein n=1 Tax=Coniosporium apollinis TaxID=61459 RepID=A0ABQ9NGS9_9PEZI|nr:hypothetical protein H2201_008496 [Coniosporium apollinis]
MSSSHATPASPTARHDSHDSATSQHSSPKSETSHIYKSILHHPHHPRHKPSSSDPRAHYALTTRNSFLTEGPGTRFPIVESAAAVSSVDAVTAFGEITPPDVLGELPKPRVQLRRKPRFSRDKDGRLEGYPKAVVGERCAPASGSATVAQHDAADRPEQEEPHPQSTSGDPDERTSGDAPSSQDTIPLLRGGGGPPDGRVPRVLWFTADGMGRRPQMPAINLSSEERENFVRGGLMGLLFGRVKKTSAGGSGGAATEEGDKGRAAGGDGKDDGNAGVDAAAAAAAPTADGDQATVSGATPAA